MSKNHSENITKQIKWRKSKDMHTDKNSLFRWWWNSLLMPTKNTCFSSCKSRCSFLFEVTTALLFSWVDFPLFPFEVVAFWGGELFLEGSFSYLFFRINGTIFYFYLPFFWNQYSFIFIPISCNRNIFFRVKMWWGSRRPKLWNEENKVINL